MFDNLTNRMQDIFKRLRGHGRLTEKDVEGAVREIRLALLEADVNYKVVKEIVERIKEKATGEEVLKSLTPAQQIVKIVHEELTSSMGGTPSKIELISHPPTIIMLVGLQGSGKTSTTAKLAYYFRKNGKRPLMGAADTYRAAASTQLEMLGKEYDIPVLSGEKGEDPISISKRCMKEAGEKGYDVVIIDTAGRLHIDEKMMDELVEIKKAVHPHQILLVVDSMTGQDAIKQASSFNEKIGFDGVILTKLDGDARGGAALSIKAVTGKPIKLVAVGEKAKDLEPFFPERMSSRILGMGDVLSLIEKAEQSMDKEKALALEEKLRREEYNLEDFLAQMEEVKKMGSLSEILNMLPKEALGVPDLKNLSLDEKELDRVKAIIQSMTAEERQKPRIIDGSRRVRIARGSGTTVTDVNKLIKQFDITRKMIGKLAGKKGIGTFKSKTNRGVSNWRLKFG